MTWRQAKKEPRSEGSGLQYPRRWWEELDAAELGWSMVRVARVFLDLNQTGEDRRRIAAMDPG